MKPEESHLSDEQLLLDVDGEISRQDEKLARAHLSACWRCRARRRELEDAIAVFVRAHQTDFDIKLPTIAGPRALLKARLAQLPLSSPSPSGLWAAVVRRLDWFVAAATCCALVGTFLLLHQGASHPRPAGPHDLLVSIPNSRLTPGATVIENERAVCAQPNTKNKAVPVSLQRKVFDEYGIAKAESEAYEVDYLITPALGGADDIHNLWPHSYSSTTWNAQVKDALEDRLRELVCDGSLDLRTAQREISTNWIAAYKKYFHTDEPLAEHTKHGAW